MLQVGADAVLPPFEGRQGYGVRVAGVDELGLLGFELVAIGLRPVVASSTRTSCERDR